MSIHPNLPPRRDSGRDQEEAASSASYQARREEVFRQRREREKRQREEEARTRQSRNGSDERGEIVESVFEKGDKALNDWTSNAANSSYHDLLVEDHHTADDVVQTLFAALNRMRTERDAAISIIQILAEERVKVKGYMAAQSSRAKQSELLYRSVGLDHKCPDFVLKAVQTAYRKSLHPDLHPAAEREEAELRFKDVEQVFAEIRRLRGLSRCS
jgi:hypothetical protein